MSMVKQKELISSKRFQEEIIIWTDLIIWRDIHCFK